MIYSYLKGSALTVLKRECSVVNYAPRVKQGVPHGDLLNKAENDH